jgi:glycosyltransferase involved in cell wall biosynthesis
MSRVAGRTWFVEEPRPARLTNANLRCDAFDRVTRVQLEVPSARQSIGFGDPEAEEYADLVAASCAALRNPVVWLYTPLGLPLAERLRPDVLVYDVMDDLAAFRFAPEEMPLRHAQALAAADLVFTGGRSLHERVLGHRHRPAAAYCFPSGVETEHFVHPRVPHERPVAGYVGVIDERLDLSLIDDLALRLPDWTVRMVGPVSKIDEADLPRRPNIEYTGKRGYDELPGILAGFDVALMPFALNEATRSISPTKTLEYLAAGLPVVSTRVRDVVRDHAHCVMFADDGEGFAQLCDALHSRAIAPPHDHIEDLLAQQHWDVIAGQMLRLIDDVQAARAANSASA